MTFTCMSSSPKSSWRQPVSMFHYCSSPVVLRSCMAPRRSALMDLLAKLRVRGCQFERMAKRQANTEIWLYILCGLTKPGFQKHAWCHDDAYEVWCVA
mmetsp:Transcript_38214/g.83188  ORF Transcript_38214/g.83188 Transcript_38214/m.83188 type:complete len:98 (+) Transcript_38214:430-723(+)